MKKDWEINPNLYLTDSKGSFILKKDGTPAKKRGRPKSKKKLYFGPEVQDAIIRYNDNVDKPSVQNKIYKEQNRDELAEIEDNQSKIISEYLPDQLNEEELIAIIDEVIISTGAESIKDMGKVMGELKKNYSDTLDFSKAGSILKEILGK